MKIPSYDDLAPSIPDISPADVLTRVGRLMPVQAPVAAAPAPRDDGPPAVLYAALHGTAIDALTAIARDFSPRIERHGATDVVLDVSGLGRLLGDAQTIGAELVRAGADRVAVAGSQTAARLLARARTGLTVADVDAAGALGSLPLAVLQSFDGRDPKPFEVLQRWGLRTLGELAALPAGDLSARLGQRGVTLQRLARGIDPRPLVPDPGVPRFIASMELEWPIEALEPLSFVFARLLDPLSAALARADRAAAAVRLDLRLTDRTMHTRQLQLPAAMRDARVLRTLLLLDLESHLPPAAVDVVTIEADPAPARIVQYSLLERALPSAETLATLNARLSALVGADRCGTAVLLDTHRPDGFAMAPLTSAEPLRRTAAADAGAPQPAPEPVLRRFRPPVAVRVALAHGRPVRVAIDRQGMPGGAIVQAAGPWRTSGEWWQRTAWDRDEWDVVFACGTACRLYRDRRDGIWFLEGTFD
jgi:protein ImuB